MEDNEFFRKAVLLILSSHELEVSLERFHRFIQEFIHVDEIFANICDIQSLSLQYLAKASNSGGEKMDLIIKIPPDTIQKCQQEMEGQEKVILIDKHLGENPFGKLVLEKLGFKKQLLKGYSKMIMILRVEGNDIGAISFVTKKSNYFTEEHARLLQLLLEPFALAVVNGKKHQEIVTLKERLSDENRFLNQELVHQTGDKIIGLDDSLKSVKAMLSQVAPLNNTVLLLGETGVGKEVFTNAIHQQSLRREGPLVKINCGAIPENLIDSELFGHETGAFTGATSRKLGRFERANGGTLFLDEIGELPLQAQVRLLRVLQNREIERVGGTGIIPIDVRIIAATHRNLEEMVKAGEFREDLWYRINIFPIRVPPLRHRKSDIPKLVDFFLIKKSKEMGFRRVPQLAPGAIERLLMYDWPGNVRELENLIEREMIRDKSGILTFRTLGVFQQEDAATPDFTSQNIPINLDQMITGHIQQVLKSTEGKVHGDNGAAKLLGVNPSTLRKKMDKLGILYGRKYQY